MACCTSHGADLRNKNQVSVLTVYNHFYFHNSFENSFKIVLKNDTMKLAVHSFGFLSSNLLNHPSSHKVKYVSCFVQTYTDIKKFVCCCQALNLLLQSPFQKEWL